MNRENLKALRDLIASQPPERLDMTNYYSENGAEPDILHNCGTAACIAGWEGFRTDWVGLHNRFESDQAESLDLTPRQAEALFTPSGFYIDEAYTHADALHALDSLIYAEADDALPQWPADCPRAPA